MSLETDVDIIVKFVQYLSRIQSPSLHLMRHTEGSAFNPVVPKRLPRLSHLSVKGHSVLVTAILSALDVPALLKLGLQFSPTSSTGATEL